VEGLGFVRLTSWLAPDLTFKLEDALTPSLNVLWIPRMKPRRSVFISFLFRSARRTGRKPCGTAGAAAAAEAKRAHRLPYQIEYVQYRVDNAET
jgi:hypothetical protein